MRYFFLLLLFNPLYAASQDTIAYVSAVNGLSLREKPSLNAKTIEKVNYGEKVGILATDTSIEIEGFTSYWTKVWHNGKTGYLAGSFLFKQKPPKPGTKTIDAYLRQVSAVAGKPVKYGNVDSSGDAYDSNEKTFFLNGAEILERTGYEYSCTLYLLPGFTIETAFQLLRLVPMYDMYIKPGTPFPTRSVKTGKDNGVMVEKDENGVTRKITFSSAERLLELEIYELEGQAVIVMRQGD